MPNPLQLSIIPIVMTACLLIGISVRAAETEPATAPASTPSATAQPALSAEVKQLLAQVDQAYSQVKALQLSGTLASDIDAGGRTQKDSRAFASSFAAPNRFRHETTGDVLFGSTGSKLYSYLKERNVYTMTDAPKDRASSSDLPQPIGSLLQQQDPSLLLALAKSAQAELVDGVQRISRLPDTSIDSAACPTLQLSLPDQTSLTLAFDPQSHLLRQMKTDIKPLLTAQGIADVKSGLVTLSYETILVDAALADEAFAWKAPDGTRDITHVDLADADNPAAALEGKPAPAFKLGDLEGKEVSLADLKGSVAILDFWATWCGPCKASLPHLAETYEKYKASGLKVYAVNVQEEKADVEKFVKQTKLTVPVLLDSEGKASEAYQAKGIPETVLIGKDGKVRKVIVGYGPEMLPELQKAIEAALRE